MTSKAKTADQGSGDALTGRSAVLRTEPVSRLGLSAAAAIARGCGVSAAADSDFPRKVELQDALRKIAWLRPAGDIDELRPKAARRLIEQIEIIALEALGERP